MAEEKKSRSPESLSVELNEAFERLEKTKTTQPLIDDTMAAESPRGGNGPLPIVSMLLALIAIGIASYAAFTVVTRPDTSATAGVNLTGSRVDAMELQLQQALSQVASLRGQLDELKTVSAVAGQPSQATDAMAAVAAVEAELEAAVAGLRQEIGTSSQDWLMAEVEYLVRLGNQRVTMERDAAGAAALFRAADDIVRTAEGVTAFDLRQALATDVAALDAVGNIDVDGIFVRLVALAGQVEDLRQVEPGFGMQGGPVLDAPQAPVGADTWSRISAWLGRVGARLASLVDYRSEGEQIRPILPPKEAYYLRQNLVLKIQMAELGLLREDQAVYDSSLADAQSWVALHFDPEHPGTVSMLRSLNELAQVRVERELPDVGNSLREVRRLLRRFHQEPGQDE